VGDVLLPGDELGVADGTAVVVIGPKVLQVNLEVKFKKYVTNIVNNL